MPLPPIASLSLFRDLPLRLTLPPELARDAKHVAERTQSTLQDVEWPAFLEQALAVAERCLAFVESESTRLTEQRFAMADPNALKQRLIIDPRRQADQLLNQLKQKLANEKQEWQRRIAKQLSEVATTVESHMETLQLVERLDHGAVIIGPAPSWLQDIELWKQQTFRLWTEHLAPLLRAKTSDLVQPDLDGLGDVLGQTISIELPVPPPMSLPIQREQAKRYDERFEAPTSMETFFEMFKGNLSTVAMLAGMVVIPVVGSLMNEASTEIRAIVMGAAVGPILAFAWFQARSHRRKLSKQSLERAREKIQRSLTIEARVELDRFKPDAERYAAHYCNSAQQVVLATIEPLVQRVFETRERQTVSDLARAQLQSEQIQDSLNTLRQIRASITGQLIVDLKRRRAELAGPVPYGG